MKVTYEKWSAQAKSLDTHEFSRDGIRDVYDTPFGIQIEEEAFIPRHFLRRSTYRTVVDVILPMDKEEWLKEKYGGWLDDQRYTEEGFGMPIFDGDDGDTCSSTRKAWRFMEAEHKNLKLLNGEPRR